MLLIWTWKGVMILDWLFSIQYYALVVWYYYLGTRCVFVCCHSICNSLYKTIQQQWCLKTFFLKIPIIFPFPLLVRTWPFITPPTGTCCEGTAVLPSVTSLLCAYSAFSLLCRCPVGRLALDRLSLLAAPALAQHRAAHSAGHAILMKVSMNQQTLHPH